MAPITWRNVDAPSFGAANNLLSAASNQIGNAGNKILGALTSFEQGQIDKNNQQDALARQQAADALAASQFQQNFGIAQQRADAGDLSNELTRDNNLASQALAKSGQDLSRARFAEDKRVTQLALDKQAKDLAYQDTLGQAALKVAQAEAIPGNNGAAALLSALDSAKSLKLKPQDEAALFTRATGEIGARTNAEYDANFSTPVLAAQAEAAQVAKDNPFDPTISLKSTPISGDVLRNVMKANNLTEYESWTGKGGEPLFKEIMGMRKESGEPYTSQELEIAFKNMPINESGILGDRTIDTEDIKKYLNSAAIMVSQNKANQRLQEATAKKAKDLQTSFEIGKRDNLRETINNLLAK